MSATKMTITAAMGDGIGPEIMAAALRVVTAAGAAVTIEKIDLGETVYQRGEASGIDAAGWDSIFRTGVLWKGPMRTPQGGGMRSLNVTLRKRLGLFANVRPCVAYAPFVTTRHPGMDVVMIRENEEDLYVGMEYRQSEELVECLKLISRPGSERIVRYAFEYARAHGRKKVSCFTKDNIMKMSDGLFHRVFEEIGAAYPEIEKEHRIVDIGAALLADAPETFDVIVLPNLYGDILSDVAAQLTGSVGLAGSANIGRKTAMFEAVHGSAPVLAGKNVANPSGVLLAAVMMLDYIGQNEVSEKIYRAWLKTIEDGIHTEDIFKENKSKKKVGTDAFAEAVVERLGQSPTMLRMKPHGALRVTWDDVSSQKTGERQLVGADVSVRWKENDWRALMNILKEIAGDDFSLASLSNRGIALNPEDDVRCVDVFSARFRGTSGCSQAAVVALLNRLVQAEMDVVKVVFLTMFDGEEGFSK